MNPIERLRLWKRDRLLKGLILVPHKKCIKRLDDVKSIGIIAHALSVEDREVLRQFSHHLAIRNIMVQLIELPEPNEELTDKYGLPVESFISLFTSYSYDAAIDITPQDDLFGLYVMLRCNTLLRVAYDDIEATPNSLKNEACDLLIRGRGPIDLTNYLGNVLRLLSQVKK